jgi:hypothetical protein
LNILDDLSAQSFGERFQSFPDNLYCHVSEIIGGVSNGIRVALDTALLIQEGAPPHAGRKGVSIMVLPPITARALATSGQRERHCQFADQAFSSEPSPESARDWYQFVKTMPGYRPEQLRGAVRHGEQVESYFLHERTMHVGTATSMSYLVEGVKRSNFQNVYPLRAGDLHLNLMPCWFDPLSTHWIVNFW